MSVSSKQNDITDPFAGMQYKVSENILFRQVENEGILLHVSSGTYYSLSETSILFWRALSESRPLILAVEQITNEYEVDRDRVLEDLANFLQDLSNCGIITSTTD
jgi:Coenzyme PQQ synthesis protein D (PqqD)